jgi:hypothetical protein
VNWVQRETNVRIAADMLHAALEGLAYNVRQFPDGNPQRREDNRKHFLEAVGAMDRALRGQDL